MTGRLPLVVVAAGAALLASEAYVTFRAEESYERGLSMTTGSPANPVADVPGRLEAYEEAFRRDPGEALYARRAAQIRLARARRADGAADPGELDAAVTLLQRAAELRPVDGSIHVVLAQAYRMRRDADAAVRAAETAVRLAPRNPFTLRGAIATGLWAWRGSGSTGALRLALLSSAALVRIGESGATAAFGPAFEESGRPLAADLLEATLGDAALRSFAADLTRASHPEAAAALAVPPARER